MDLKNKNSFSKDELVACSNGDLFGPKNGRLPNNEMLMMDRIIEINDSLGDYNNGEIQGELDITPELWFFDCHFSTDPVMPGCLGLDAMWQLLGFYLLWEGNSGIGRALGSGQVKFYGQVLPKAKLVEYKISIKKVRKQKLVIGFADGLMFVDGKEIYSAKDLRVGLFEDPQNF
tara:strand:+ start:31741 stop:32262 length:522 start_codon:yes stop_codon:yes gene_type:complete